jgi:hypothetical protein
MTKYGQGSCEDGHNSDGVLIASTEHITKAKVIFSLTQALNFSLSMHIISIQFLGTLAPHQHHGTISAAHRHNPSTHLVARKWRGEYAREELTSLR